MGKVRGMTHVDVFVAYMADGVSTKRMVIMCTYTVNIHVSVHTFISHDFACMLLTIPGCRGNPHSKCYLSHDKKHPLTFHYTGCLIGILIMVYHDPYIIG